MDRTAALQWQPSSARGPGSPTPGENRNPKPFGCVMSFACAASSWGLAGCDLVSRMALAAICAKSYGASALNYNPNTTKAR